MRALVSLVVVLAIVMGAYYFYFQRLQQPTPGAGGTVPTQAITLTGVKNDLNAIARAERTWFAEKGVYATLEELTSSGALTLKASGRDGYTYVVEVSENGFTVTARYHGSSGLSYPTLTVDQTMEIRQSQ